MSNQKEKQSQKYPNNKKKNFPVCPICSKSVRYLLTAIAVNDDMEPAHFDCVLKKIGEQEELEPKEKVCYLGNGSFGIITLRSGPGAQRFTVRKTIQYENLDQKIEWRKKISKNIKNGKKSGS